MTNREQFLHRAEQPAAVVVKHTNPCGVANFFRRGGSVSCQWSLGPGSRPGVACLSRADDRVMHPRFSLEGGVGRTRSQDSVAGTGVLVELCVGVNALLVVAGYS